MSKNKTTPKPNPAFDAAVNAIERLAVGAGLWRDFYDWREATNARNAANDYGQAEAYDHTATVLHAVADALRDRNWERAKQLCDDFRPDPEDEADDDE